MGPVIVVNHRLAAFSVLHRHIESVEHEIRRLTGVDCPANYFPRVNTDDTAAIHFPPRVGCSVISVHHSWLGLSAVNLRFTRSATVIRCSRLTYRLLVPGIPRKPVRDMTRPT